MLAWLTYFIFFIFLVLISFLTINNSLLHLLIASEGIIILFFCLCLSGALYYNVYILLLLSLFILIFGGLELSLNLLLITV